MPALSDTMSNGRLVKWTKKIGDSIKRGETVAELETDKAVMEVEAFHDGYLAGPLARENTDIPVGEVIGYIADSAAAPAIAPTAASTPAPPSTPPLSAAAAAPPPFEPHPAPGPPAMQVRPANSAGVRASPYARRLAQQLGVDVSKIEGQAEVHADAILDAARRAPPTAPGTGPVQGAAWPSHVRELVARNMIKSLETPMFRIVAHLPAGPAMKAAKALNISFTLLLARAGALAVKANPLFNSVYTPQGLAPRRQVNVGIAVDTPDGLVAAVLRDVANRALAQLSTDWRSLRERVDNRRLRLEDCNGATFYLSNLGTFPVVHSFDAVLPRGAAAILCVGAADGERAVFTLGCDHRVVAGADAARFLQSFAQLLADPSRLSN
jgi:pyruvate dehydrogenase E2 component (dihydrolipoamide acetyltransferase)